MSRIGAVKHHALALYGLVTAYVRGYRFGKDGMPPMAALPKARTPGRLERYFDQNTTGPGLWKWRHYFPIYEKHLARFVGQSPTVLEIGIFSGGSLGMWRDYFGDGLELYGVDIELACRAYEDQATVLIGDQADPRFLQNVIAATPAGLDVVLDDGGHEAYQQIASLEALLPHLRPGGVYICEDIHRRDHAFHAYINGLATNLHATESYESFPALPAQAAIESITIYPFVVVIEKRQHRLERLEAPKHGSQWQPFYERDYQTPYPMRSSG